MLTLSSQLSVAVAAPVMMAQAGWVVEDQVKVTAVQVQRSGNLVAGGVPQLVVGDHHRLPRQRVQYRRDWNIRPGSRRRRGRYLPCNRQNRQGWQYRRQT